MKHQTRMFVEALGFTLAAAVVLGALCALLSY